jgi:hypothetical protein
MNPVPIGVDTLFGLLDSLSTFAEHKIRLYALGGTALTILGIKPSTLDIDINVGSEAEYRYISSLFEELGFQKEGTMKWTTQEGLRFDLFHSSNILGTQLLPDCLTKAKFIRKVGSIELYTLSPEDIIISKLARGIDRDFDDIRLILDHEKINLNSLATRYRNTMQDSVVSLHKQKFLDLIDIKYKEWGRKPNTRLIAEVRKW